MNGTPLEHRFAVVDGYKDTPADLLRTVGCDAFTCMAYATIEELVNFIASAIKNLPHRETHAQA